MNVSTLSLNALRTFHAVAQHGGFTRASKILRVQQPAISRAVALLEDELGVVLLERHKRSTTLTQVGHQVFASCARLFGEVENIAAIAQAEQHACSGPLRFAAASAIASDLVPRVLARFLKAHPAVWPMSTTATANVMLEQIAAHQLELGLLFHVPRLTSDVVARELAQVRFALVIATKHKKDATVRASFIGSREVDDVANRAYPTLDRLRRDVPAAQIRISSNDASAHKKMVLAGLGVAVLPLFMVKHELAAGVLTSMLPKDKLVFPLHLVTRKNQVLARAASLFLEHVEAVLAER